MLISQEVIKEYCPKISGVLHIGAHICQEQNLYNSLGVKKVIWVDAIPRNVNVIEACISDVDGEEVTFNITNNQESSSILELKKHAEYYPNITVNNTIKMKTKTVKTLYKEQNFSEDVANFLNMDIQGVELHCLKGMGELLKNFQYIYTEVNKEELYKNCSMIEEIDNYLTNYNFLRVETVWTQQYWGDALYIKLENPPCYWLNMDKNSQKREDMLSQFKKYKNKQIRISSIPDNVPYFSCIKGHLEMIKTAYFDGCSIAIFFEDDIDMTNLDVYQEYWKYLPNDWECYAMHHLEGMLTKYLKKNSCENRPIKGYFNSVAAQMMNRKGMKNFLNVMGILTENSFTPTYKLLDNARAEEFVFRHVNTYTSLYPLFNTNETISDLQPFDHFLKNNYQNMLDINEILKDFPVIPPPTGKLITLSHDCHWFGNVKELEKELFKEQEEHTKINDISTYSCVLHGGLGNRLFQYFSIKYLAKKHNKHFNIHSIEKNIHNRDNKNYYENFFIEYLPIVHHNQIIYEEIYTYLEVKFSTNFSSLIDTEVIFKGHFQNEQYFAPYREEILEILKEPLYITKTLDSLNINFDKTIAIHVRLGDYIHPNLIAKHFVNLLDYYKKAINLAQETMEGVKFIIVSNVDIHQVYAVYHNLKDYPNFINNSGDVLYDLFFMSRCRGVICSNSTFAWWGAWINTNPNKFVTIPSKWLQGHQEILNMQGATVVQVHDEVIKYQHDFMNKSEIDIVSNEINLRLPLAFDIGANIGKWTDANINKYSIISVEASPTVFEMLLKTCKNDRKNMVNKAVCNNNCQDITFYQAETDVLSTINKEWLTNKNCRFFNYPYSEVMVKSITIDALISQYGKPELIKIDVEGGEYECISSLSQKVNLLCFEWSSETNHITFKCLDHLHILGFDKFYIQNEDNYTFVPNIEDYMNLSYTKSVLYKKIPKLDWGMLWCR